ncbi:hypothetical protein EHRUM4_06480 [Ehrlichia ruminantium]|uniref:hypothetical protein n=1 Tax=Ehrlichia ruminantium TaxID=779 RepID=UPI0007C10C1A|nr:hypothetical protein [Ehrlichia ruminantium]GAT75428.1 hypothetical protein EHRUM4_06480 [Ehrlichia ruminantium]
MLFKYNPDNTKEIHEAALQCLGRIKIRVYHCRCIGYTGNDGTLNVILDPYKIRPSAKPRLGYSLFYMKGSISPKTLSTNQELINMAKAVVSSSILNATIKHRHTAPCMALGWYMLIHSDNLSLLTEKNALWPAINLNKFGKILLCKPISIGNGAHPIHMDFDEHKALQELKELQIAYFMMAKPIPQKNIPLSTRCFSNYSILQEEPSISQENSTTDNIIEKDISSNEQGAVGGVIQPQQLTDTEAITYGINFLTDVSIALEKICEKYY